MYDVVTIGSATRDAFVASKDFRVIDDSTALSGKGLAMPLGAKIEVDEVVFTTGGGATNAAVTFSRQQFKTATIAAVGADISGKSIVEELMREGVETRFMQIRDDLRTAYSILLHPAGSGERTVLVYRGAAGALDRERIPWADLKTTWFYCSSVVGDLDLLRAIVSAAKNCGAMFAYNPGGKEIAERDQLLPILQDIDVLIVNREEAALITRAPKDDTDRIFRAWDELTPGKNINVMTDARAGVTVSDGKILYTAGIFEDRGVRDRTGAGDAFGSGFVAGLVRRLSVRNTALREVRPEDIEYAIRLGSANATAKVEGVGAKYGLLTVEAFEGDERWSSFPVTRKSIA